ncbi:MAG: ABC transporter ATP-binding protein [Flavobacteriaceae bacterium]|jgi:iron complex transport system ATP-binding protein|nr:ABC transporter ATP-binding protein [Flavobacteriaceae bacterium]
MNDTTLLHTKNLSIGYSSKKETKVIQTGINIELKQGQLISLLGINGIGKTTLLRTLAGLQSPLEGQIILNSTSLINYSQTELAKQISVVLTERIPDSNLSVIDLLQISRIPHLNWNNNITKNDLFYIDKAITLTHIDQLVNLNVNTLSDGQRQRVFIARAIAQNTPIIILDEPSSHLDLHHKVDLYLLLKNLAHNENKAILFSSHDMDLCLEITDESIVFQKDTCLQNTNSALIDAGIFDNFFNTNNLFFDRQQKRFNLK